MQISAKENIVFFSILEIENTLFIILSERGFEKQK